MRTLILTAAVLATGIYVAITPSPDASSEPRAGAATVAEARLIARLRDMAKPPVLLADAYAPASRATADLGAATPTGATPGETVVAAVEVLTVNASALNVRAEPSSGSQVLGRLLQGETVEVAQRKNGWVEVANADGLVGWAHGDYLVSAN